MFRSQEVHTRAATFALFAQAMMLAKGDTSEAVKIFTARNPGSSHLPLIEKLATSPGTSTDANWASPLAPLRPFADAFMDAIVRKR